MSGHRIDRTTEDIKRELTDIFKSVKDPRVADCFISIIRVEVTNDLSYCTVYFSVIEGMERAKEALKGLKSATGYIRRELARTVNLRNTPEIKFILDQSIEYGVNMSKKIEEVTKDLKDDEEVENGNEAE